MTASIERRAKFQNIDNDDQFALTEYKEALETRQTELGQVLRDLEAFPHHPQSAKWWQLFTTRGILPFPGAWLDQPAWWLEDVQVLELLDEYHNLPYEIASVDKQLKDAAKRMIDRALRG